MLASPKVTGLKVNTGHFAASGLLFSGVPSNQGFVNLMNGRAGTVVSSPTEAIINPIGRAAVFATGGGTQAYRFSGMDSTNYTTNTIAVICSLNGTPSSNQLIFSNTTTDAGLVMNVTSAAALQLTMFGVVAVSSGITLSLNVPYFIVASKTSSAVNWLVKRLDTGVITTAATGSGSPNAGNGTYAVGNGWASGNVPMGGNLAAAMLSSAFHPKERLLQWSKDPWEFWKS